MSLRKSFEKIILFCQNFGTPKVLTNHQYSTSAIGELKDDQN